MHSHDRTLLASLGFSDKDKRNARHDLACQYLVQQDVAQKLVVSAAKPGVSVVSVATCPEYHITKGDGRYKTTIGFADLLLSATLDLKAEYRERVLCPTFRDDTPAGWAAWEFQAQLAAHETVRFMARAAFLVEVKIEAVPVGDIIRQMRLYSEYVFDHSSNASETFYGPLDTDKLVTQSAVSKNRITKCPLSYPQCRCAARDYWRLYGETLPWLHSQILVVTDFDLKPNEVSVLQMAGIAHVRLGAAFQTYVDAQQQTAANTSIEV